MNVTMELRYTDYCGDHFTVRRVNEYIYLSVNDRGDSDEIEIPVSEVHELLNKIRTLAL